MTCPDLGLSKSDRLCWQLCVNCVCVQSSSDESRRRKADTASRPSGTSSKTVCELRAERVRREQRERQRAQELLQQRAAAANSCHSNASLASPLSAVDDERRRRYNSQFNPDIARRPRTDHY